MSAYLIYGIALRENFMKTFLVHAFHAPSGPVWDFYSFFFLAWGFSLMVSEFRFS